MDATFVKPQNVKIEEVMEAMWRAYASSVFKDKKVIFGKWRAILRRRAKTTLVLKLGNRHWLVESESRPGEFHAVDWQLDKYVCCCEDATCRKRACKHVATIIKVEEETLAAA